MLCSAEHGGTSCCWFDSNHVAIGSFVVLCRCVEVVQCRDAKFGEFLEQAGVDRVGHGKDANQLICAQRLNVSVVADETQLLGEVRECLSFLLMEAECVQKPGKPWVEDFELLVQEVEASVWAFNRRRVCD